MGRSSITTILLLTSLLCSLCLANEVGKLTWLKGTYSKNGGHNWPSKAKIFFKNEQNGKLILSLIYQQSESSTGFMSGSNKISGSRPLRNLHFQALHYIKILILRMKQIFSKLKKSKQMTNFTSLSWSFQLIRQKLKFSNFIF